MSVGAVVLCRLDSTRLPGKVLRNVRGRPLLDYLLTRARRIPELHPVVVATSERPVDDPLADFCRENQVPVFRGPADDVAGRAVACASHYGMRRFCRMNGDSPHVEPSLVKQGLQAAEEQDVDLVTNLYPRSFPYGVSVEVIDTGAFERAYRRMSRPEHLEHVTKYLYEQMDEIRFFNIACPDGDLSAHRMTIDTEGDFRRFEHLIGQMGHAWEGLSYRDVLALPAST